MSEDYVESNRRLWNEWTKIHETSAFYDLKSFVDGSRPMRLRDFEIAEVGDVSGKDLLHVQCHFGIDTLSWARLGARVTGADFSEEAIALARRVAEETELDATFVHSNIFELPEVLERDFDIVYTSRGVLGWLPDMTAWAEVVTHFIRPGGVFYIHEAHPVMMALDEESEEIRFGYPYFTTEEPLAFPGGASYADPTVPVETDAVEYGWNHSLGEIVTALAQAGLHIEFLHERTDLDWEVRFLEPAGEGLWKMPQRYDGMIPLSFSLRASKPLSFVRQFE